ncbi:MAG: tol-pal system protein [Paracoccus sp. (in: a-proteobacteria)]|nr:tol-pal system protein [Paracoccus sp. (in: a-proteobacteria)]
MIGRLTTYAGPALVLSVLLAGSGLAQETARDATLGDMRSELAQLRVEFQRLRAELVASGPAGFEAAGGDAAIDRMNAMESQLMRLTDQAELLQNRISRTATEAERRLADLEFRMCEIDETCDLSALTVPGNPAMQAPELAPSAPAENVTRPDGPVASADEQADFDAAEAALNAGDNVRAAQLFASVAQVHAGGPLTAEALYLRGVALDRAGDGRGAATAWLEGFAADPDGARAGESLLGIARVIEEAGDGTAACLYLAEIPARFPGSAAAAEAEQRLVRLACGNSDLGALDPLLDPDLDPEALADLVEHDAP